MRMITRDACPQILRRSLILSSLLFAAQVALCSGDLSDAASPNASVLVEAEAFADIGGWSVDQQFMGQMGSSFLQAHGLCKPVADALRKRPNKGCAILILRIPQKCARVMLPCTQTEYPITLPLAVQVVPYVIISGKGKLATGTCSFGRLRESGFIYVDKTA